MAKSNSTKPNTIKRRTRSGLNSGLDVLECVASAQHPLTLSEISARIAMSKSSVHTLLASLQLRGYLHRDDDHRYSVGVRTWELGCSAGPATLSRTAGLHMTQLVRELSDGASLAVLDGADMVCIQLVESSRAVRVHNNIGDRTPAYCVSSGLAYLAQLTEADVLRLLPENLKQGTPQTFATRTELLAELRQVRARGYAYSRGAWRPEVAGISVPVFGPDNRVAAALCIAAPAFRTNREWQTVTVLALKATARAIERDIGRPDDSWLAGLPHHQ